MRTITAGHLRARLGEVLDRAAAGERLIVERDHHPIAAIVPIEDTWQLDDGEEARQRTLDILDEIAANAERMRKLYPPPDDGFEDSAARIRWERDHGHEDGA